MKFRFIADHQEEWPVRVMCDVLGVSPAGYFAWRCRPESARAAANQNLLADVRRLQAQHRGRYGSPRMHAALRAEGRSVSRGRVERLMRRHGIRAAASRRFRPVTTDSRHGLPVAPNLLEQRFEASAPNQVWLADLTYGPTGEGWLYLAAVLDLATRKVVGWAMRDHLRTELAAAALVMATQRQRPGPGLIHHSDRGSQGGFKRSSQHLDGEEVAMNGRKRRSDRSGREPLFSPGRPPAAGREQRERFWAAIATPAGDMGFIAHFHLLTPSASGAAAPLSWSDQGQSRYEIRGGGCNHTKKEKLSNTTMVCEATLSSS